MSKEVKSVNETRAHTIDKVCKCGVSGLADEMQSPSLPSPAEEGTFSCQVPSFSPLVVLADRHWNMPYCSWQLSPSGPDSTLLTVNGAHLQVKVEIKVGTADHLTCFCFPIVCDHLSPPLVTLPPVHFMQVHPDVHSCVVEGVLWRQKSVCQQLRHHCIRIC